MNYAANIRIPTFAASLAPLVANATPVNPPGPAGSGLTVFLITFAASIVAVLLLWHRIRPLKKFVSKRRGQKHMRRGLQGNDVYTLDNFILPGACDGLTRVDHAVLTAAGLVCIRAKHGNGLVFGASPEPQWNCVDGVDNCQFLNPLIQNEGRAQALQRVVPDIPVTSLVVFTGDIHFSQNVADNVIHVSQLAQWLERFQQQPALVQDIDTAWMNLKAAARTDDASHRDFEAQLSFG